MIDLMPASMALLAPNVNSCRRPAGMYVPTQASWGHNNRTVALRIPAAIAITIGSSTGWQALTRIRIW
jgi:glutamine synthetase